MACAAAACSSHLQQFASGSRVWTSDVPRQDSFSGKRDVRLTKVAPMRRSSAISAAGRSSSSEAATDFNGRCSPDACLDKPCPMSPATNCPGNNSDATGNVERWVEESVHEIVRNIQDAPFLHYIFDSQKRPSRIQRSRRLKISADLVADPSCWPAIREALSKGNDPPDGVILVQKLFVEPGQQGTAVCCLAAEEEAAAGEEEGFPRRCCPRQGEGAETNAVWGVLVQSRGGGNEKNACYLLKTTMVASSVGVCTRYCLTRATCFGPSYVEQLENAWLL